MKIIFLDLDGVLNNWNHPDLIDLKNAKVLKKIITLSKAKLVLTSSNKYPIQRENRKSIRGSYLKKYLDILMPLGIFFYDMTPYVAENRELEIKAYLKSNPFITDFVIIDDEFISSDLEKYQVLLDWHTGLLDLHITPVLAILNGNLEECQEDYELSKMPIKSLVRINKYYK